MLRLKNQLPWTAVLSLLLCIGDLEALTFQRATSDPTKCSYGERGSLTATCVNANPSYFKATQYRFDQLDETLRCLNCTLTTLESGTFDLSGNQIKFLDLRNSSVQSVKPKAFVGLIFMEHLSLGNNEISNIFPGSFSGVKKIKTLDLDNNKINSLSDGGFTELINLEKLQLQNNQIAFMPTKAFTGLNNLVELNLQNNRISNVSAFSANLTNLKVLNLRENLITSLMGQEFYNLTSLRLLDLAWNKITIPSISINPEPSGNSLVNLDLSHNQINKLNPDIFGTLQNLENLDLSFNNIAEVPQKTLQSLHNLRNLNISSNKLTVFQTGLYSGLPQLRVLNFSHNALEDVEITGVFTLHSLHALDLSYNNLNDLDYIALISRLPRLNYLQLQNNVLPCDLEKEMEIFFSEDNFKYVLYGDNPGDVKCVNVEVKKRTFKEVADSLVREASNGGSRTAEIWIFVLISIMMILIGTLFFMEYRTFQALRYKSGDGRSMSRVNLVVTDSENIPDNDFLKE
ncbi:unnamed protein product [Brassicogethes aeneus]|uniref:Uncharacterized protein n=1 Tax=Brassicogethes aeneus TaxID=1431903 RepID=A0A9P0FBI9_BRAAE|nr:unnamed protein product [Brassicogethes aeneus]